MNVELLKNLNHQKVDDAYLIRPHTVNDERGFFSRIFDSSEFNKIFGYDFQIKKVYNSLSLKKNTFRGMHAQKGDFAETKIIRCISGSLINYIFDNRKSSKTFRTLIKIQLTAANRFITIVPKGCLNGFHSLSDNSEVIYFSNNEYSPKHEYGIRPNDDIFKGKINLKNIIISPKDLLWNDYN